MEDTSAEALIKWLKEKYYVDVLDATKHYIAIVYTKSDYKFDSAIPEEFWALKIQYNYPEIIILSNGHTYMPNLSKYDPKIEFITLKIYK